MYNKNFFQKRFALTPTQADDYAIAFGRICQLLQDYDPLQKHRRNAYYDYQKEALLLLEEMPGNLKQAQHLLKKVCFLFVRSRLNQIEAAAKKLLSIADCYIWPASVYDDWKEVSATDHKAAFSPLSMVEWSNTPKKKSKKKR